MNTRDYLGPAKLAQKYIKSLRAAKKASSS